MDEDDGSIVVSIDHGYSWNPSEELSSSLGFDQIEMSPSESGSPVIIGVSRSRGLFMQQSLQPLNYPVVSTSGVEWCDGESVRCIGKGSYNARESARTCRKVLCAVGRLRLPERDLLFQA